MRAGVKHTHVSFRSATVAAVLIVCTVSQAAAQAGGADTREQFEHGFEHYEPWHLPSGTDKGEAGALNSRWKALGEELKSTASEFAGDYRSGSDMRQSFLRWAPGGGFVYLYVYEHFAVLDFSYGKVTVAPSEIIFTVERERRAVEVGGRGEATPRRWVAARWRRSNYLVPAKEIADFGNYVGGFAQYNDFNGPCCEFTPFLAAEARENRQTSFDAPVVPRPYARLMRRPIEATIKFVGRKRVVKDYRLGGPLYGTYFERASLTPVRVDAGRRQGVKPGLLFRLADAPEGQYLKIRRAGGAFSEGVIVRDVDDDGRETYYDFNSGAKGPERKVFPPVEVGTKVTTSPATL